MKRIGLVWALGLLGGCATEVYHETRSREQAQRDIETCSRHGKLVSPYEPIGALNAAYKCLDDKGYKRRGVAPLS